ncbi:MAG TPA: ankyrin repeat domain-containing protein, partial [Spirochaetia bacterium]|nr:ankyrin repeat domain-containing protein [Spirochaetia bacterium]
RSGNTPLHVAVQLGYGADTAPIFLDAGAFVDSANAEGDTPLALAVRKARPDWSRLLVEKGAAVFARNSTGLTPLAAAVSIGPEAVDPLLIPSTIRARDDSGNGLLHAAVLLKAIPETLVLMMERGVDPSTRNNAGDTPLHIAVRTDQTESARVLLAARTDIFAANVRGETPLGLALASPSNPKRWFFTEPVLAARDGAGNTPLHYAASEGLAQAADFLVSVGASPEARNADGQTPLHSAVRKDSPDSIRALVTAGADLSARDLTGATPLHQAVYWNARRSMESLVLAGSDVNARDFAGASPVFEAVRRQDASAVRWLLDRGADPAARNDAGRTPLHDAAVNGDLGTVQLLLAAGAAPNARGDGGATALHEAVGSDRVNVIPALIARGADIHARNFAGETPLTLALGRGTEVLKALLTGGAALSVDSDGRSVLRVILEAKPTAGFVEIALAAGARTGDRDRSGATALHAAVSQGYTEIVRLLVVGGADVFARDRDGNSPLSLAMAAGQEALGAVVTASNVNARDLLGNRPLHYAAQTGNAAAAEFLLNLGADRGARNSAGDTAAEAAEKRGFMELAGKLR